MHWTPDWLQHLSEASSPDVMFKRATSLVRRIDMEYLGFNLYLHESAHRTSVIVYNNYPKKWNLRSRSLPHSITGDPISARCRQAPGPVLWEDELYAEARDFRRLAVQCGLRYGWTHSLHDQYSAESQLSVARDGQVICHREFLDKSAHVLLLHNCLHGLIAAHHMRSLMVMPDLSERELEVAKWTAEGKTADDIGRILSLSTSTVNFHVRSLIKKFNAPNKTAAIAQAASRGLLWGR